MASFLRKLNVLLWKSYTVRKYHWIITLLELCVPIFLFVGLAILNSYGSKLPMSAKEQVFDTLSEKKLIQSMQLIGMRNHILYTPVNDVTRKLMQILETDFLKDTTDDVQDMRSETDMEMFFKQSYENGSESRVFGIVFLEDMTKTPLKSFNYKIRSLGSPYTSSNTGLFAGFFDAATAAQYEDSGFLPLQMMMNRCFMKLIGTEIKSTIAAQKFPLPGVEVNPDKEFFLVFLPYTTVLSFIFLCPGVLKRVVEEKQTGIKELMKLMGMPSLLLWLGWFVHAMSILCISITVITIVVGIPISPDYPLLLCSGSVIWIFLLLYCTASVTFLFAVSALFKRPTLAMVFGLLVWIGTGVAIKFVTGSHITYFYKILCSLLPNIPLAWGFNSIFIYENRGLRMSLADVLKPSIAMGDNFHLWEVWLVLIMQAFLYSCVTLYLEAISPGDYGVARPWYFPFTDCCKWVRVAPQSDMKGGTDNDAETFEPLAETLPVGIKIHKLRKIFKSAWNKTTRVAVDDLSLDICKEQITALLGHNGAGKTTTMMILTGMLSPSGGTVEINGYNIKYHMDKVRENLGLCPQHNLLFTDLTVRQHLIFFAKLKGSADQDPEAEVSLYAKRLNLTPYLNKRPDELSGGYKRRLCLALAFIGQSKTIILDEPTSGLDPEARREIWDLLLSMRGSRTILITTHVMEEADVLGDRIAIMDHGQVQCYGTPMYLKKLYGTGYVLSILKKSSGDVIKIAAAIKDVIPEAELKSSVGSLMTFCVPDAKRNLFPELFALLNRERVPLGLDSIGVSITTLEEVFLRVGEIALEESGKNEDLTSELSEKSECSMLPLAPHGIKGFHLWLQQLEALVVKRALVLNFKYLIQVVLMVLVIIFVTVMTLHPFGGKPISPLRLDLPLYEKTDVLYNSVNRTPEQLIASYKSNVMNAGSEAKLVPYGTNITSALLKVAYEERETYIFKYIVAGQLNKSDSEFVALYSDMALHSLPISVNLLTNALIQYETNDKEYSISVTNHPFQQDEPEFLDKGLVILMWVALVPLALSFWMGLFVIQPMEERVSSSRQLQCMAGVSLPTYWFTMYLCDILLHLILCVILVFAVVCVDKLGVFSGIHEVATLFGILMLYGMSAIPFSYFVSFWKDTWAGCYSTVIIVNILGGLKMAIIVSVVQSLDIKAYEGVQAVFRLLPNFAFTQVLQQFVSQVMDNKVCLRISKSLLKQRCSHNYNAMCCSCIGEVCDTAQKSYFQENQSLFLYLGLSWILYLGLVFVLDMRICEWLWEKLWSAHGTSEAPEPTGNDDVDGEAQCVEEIFRKDVGTAAGADLLVNNLKKKYGIMPKFLAVKGVSFQVKPGECFGLLGVNGAGKTTTFKMLTGATVPTRGVASIAGYRSDKHKSQYLSQIGYCPQHDALIECLTAYNTLRFYGAIRGVPKDKLNQEVERWIHMMGLKEYKNKTCGTYSGGNKRKLMAAIALIGGPPLVFLDEPTSGVDPVARRNLWNSLVALQKAGQSIVLTSHSMEECEALCNRLGIMVGGQLMCMGNIPYLKNKYKQGSTVKIKLRAGSGEEAIQDVKSKMETAFAKIALKDAHETLLHYQVTDPNVGWDYMFKTMEILKDACEIVEDYTISETTLEEVFLSFAQA